MWCTRKYTTYLITKDDKRYILCYPLHFIGERMATNWTEYATKIETLLQSDSASQGQAYELLMALVQQVQEAGQQQCFLNLFEPINFSNGQVGWMKRKSDSMRWSERRMFEEEIEEGQWFWRWIDIYYELFPEKLQEVPSEIMIKGLKKWRTYLNQSSCEEIRVSSIPPDGMKFAGIEHSNLRKIIVAEEALRYLSYRAFLQGSGRLIVVENVWNPHRMIAFEEINNQRSIVVCRRFGPWIPLEEFTFEEHPNLQVVDTHIHLPGDTSPFNIRAHRPPWTSQTPYDFLDWNSCWIFLNGDSSKSICERVVQIRVEERYLFERLGRDFGETLFGDAVFPNLSSIYINTGSKSASQSLLLNSETLNRFPSLKMIHITGDLDVELTSDVFEQVHPLEVVFQKDSLVTYFAFDKTIERSLGTQLVAVSTQGDWVKHNIRFLSNLRAVNMTQLWSNVAFVRELTSVETILIEQDAQDLPQLAILWDGFFVPGVLEDWKKTKLKYPKRLIEEYGVEKHEESRLNYPDMPTRVHDYDTLMSANFIHPDEPISERYCGFLEDNGPGFRYTCSAGFVQQFTHAFQNQTLPSECLNWMKRRSDLQGYAHTAIRIGGNVFWLDHLDKPQMGGWHSVCSGYLDCFMPKVWYGGFCYLNLMRTVVGYSILPEELTPRLLSNEFRYCDREGEEHQCGILAIRYNTSLIPFEVIEQLTLQGELRRLRVEETSILSQLSKLKPLKILHMVELQLTELPSDLGELTELEELYLWGNELTTLPDSMSKMTKLWKIFSLFLRRQVPLQTGVHGLCLRLSLLRDLHTSTFFVSQTIKQVHPRDGRQSFLASFSIS